MYNQRQIKMTEKKKLLVLCVALFCFIAVSAQQRMSVSSPDGKLRFSLKVTPESVSYDIDYRKQILCLVSALIAESSEGILKQERCSVKRLMRHTSSLSARQVVYVAVAMK